MRLLLSGSTAALVVLVGHAMAGPAQTESESRKVFACRQQFDDGTVLPPYYYYFDYQKSRVFRSVRPDKWLAKEMLLIDFEDRAVFNEEETTISQFEPEFAKATGLQIIDANKKEAMTMVYIRYAFDKKSNEISELRRGFTNWGTYGVAEDEPKYIQSKVRHKCLEIKFD